MFLLRPLQPRTSPSLRTPGRVLTPLGMTEALTFLGLSSVKEGRPVGLILISPDSLGVVNENYGREAGDQVVNGLGILIQSLVGDSGKLGHIDGANFLLMIYPSDLELARGRANMIRARVRTHEFPCSDSVAQITVSAGILSVEPAEGDDFRSLGEGYFSQLNQALHAAKKAGGNRVEVV